jgi:hypothetical protein
MLQRIACQEQHVASTQGTDGIGQPHCRQPQMPAGMDCGIVLLQYETQAYEIRGQA